MHGEDADIAALEDALTRLIRRSVLPVVGEANRAAAGVTLDRAPYVALVRIDERAPVRLSELAEVLDLDVSTASRHVAKLEQLGLVSRENDPADGRACLLAPTPEGLEVLVRVRDARRRRLAEWVGHWEHRDVASLADLLTRFLDDDPKAPAR